MQIESLFELTAEIKKVARDYYKITGKPLGITGEIAELEAARILKLSLATARQPGYDATEYVNGVEKKVQIKGRCLQGKNDSSNRVGAIKIDKEWDSVLLVLLNTEFEPTHIYEASRSDIEAAYIHQPSAIQGMHISKFKSISTLRWENASPSGGTEITFFPTYGL